MKSGVDLIQEERARHSTEEGWTTEHDDRYRAGELRAAAICYAAINITSRSPMSAAWPWGHEWWKPSDDPVRNLVKAGALIAAEIDRTQRRQAWLDSCSDGEES